MIRLLHHSQQHNNNITTITYVPDPGLLQNTWVWLYNDVYLVMSLSVIAVSDPQVIVCKLLVPKLVSEILAHKPCDYEINILKARPEDKVYFYLVFFNILQEVSSFHLWELISQGNSVFFLAVTYKLICVLSYNWFQEYN